MVTVYLSKRYICAAPYFCLAYICMTSDGMDTLMAVTAMRSRSVMSSSFFIALGPRIEIHRQRGHGRDALHFGGGDGAVPQREKRGRAGCDEIRGAREQSVIHHGGSADVDPAHLQVGDAGIFRVLLDEAVLLHDEQRQESDAAGADGEAHFVDFGLSGRGKHGREASVNRRSVSACRVGPIRSHPPVDRSASTARSRCSTCSAGSASTA